MIGSVHGVFYYHFEVATGVFCPDQGGRHHDIVYPRGCTPLVVRRWGRVVCFPCVQGDASSSKDGKMRSLRPQCFWMSWERVFEPSAMSVYRSPPTTTADPTQCRSTTSSNCSLQQYAHAN